MLMERIELALTKLNHCLQNNERPATANERQQRDYKQCRFRRRALRAQYELPAVLSSKPEGGEEIVVMFV